jgi:F-type H+-transporting ATPase subunit delta
MNESKISVRYARALYLAAERSGEVPSVASDIRQLSGLIAESDELKEFLKSTVIRKSRKLEILKQLFADDFNPLTMRFLNLLAENRRESRLLMICLDFTVIVREKQGISPVTVTTSGGLNSEVKENIRRFLELKTGKTIELTEKIKPEILGGLILRIGDLQYDGSISNQLKKIRDSFLKKELSEIKI